MQFTGINYRSVPTSPAGALNFSSLTLYNTGDLYNGSLPSGVHFGFSGASDNISFLMRSGKIYDPQNRVVYGYRESEPFSFALKFNDTHYEYSFNDALRCSNSSKNSFSVNKFFINCNGMSVDADFTISQNNISYDITYPETYSSSSLNITFTNNSNSDIKIFSAEITSNNSAYYSVSSIDNIDVSANSSEILTLTDLINDIGVAQIIFLSLHTNFGEINKQIQSLRT